MNELAGNHGAELIVSSVDAGHDSAVLEMFGQLW